jgi:predicted nucleic acid-binding protein
MGTLKVYFDSNVLIAAVLQSHQHHVPSVSALSSVHNRAISGLISAHGLAEIYGFLSRSLYPEVMYPFEAWQSISKNILPQFSIITLKRQDYKVVLERCASIGVGGGRVYDALHIQAAINANCDRLFTFNVKHFRQLAPSQFAHRVVLPS